jgi:predicted transcriptional regulator
VIIEGKSMSAKPRCFDLERVSSPDVDLWKDSQASATAMCAHRRDRHEILAEILEAARGGVVKTHIMYKAKLSYGQLNGYLILLLQKGFMENLTIKRKSRTMLVWRTTEKGMRFLGDFRLLEM